MSDGDVGYEMQLEQSNERLEKQSNEYRIAYEEAQKRIKELTTSLADLQSRISQSADVLMITPVVGSLLAAEVLYHIADGGRITSEYFK